MNVYRRVKTDPAEWFSPEEVQKAKDYKRPLTKARLAKTAITLVAMVAIVATQAAPELLDAGGISAWPLRLVLTLLGLMFVSVVIDIPFEAWQAFVHDRRWEFSTTDRKTFVVDQIKGFVLSAVLLSVLLLPVWALIRSTDLWWLFGWLVFFGFTVVLAVLAPVVLLPIFNKITPLDRPELAERLKARAESVGLAISDVFVMDASKRTTKDNAAMAGLGKTRRVILFDNILSYPDEEIEIVVAHELSHWRRGHIPRMIAVGGLATLLLFLALWGVSRWDAALEWAGVQSVGDPAVLPLVGLVFGFGSWILGVVQNFFSRAWEREADLDALAWTQDTERFQAMMRRLATKNLSDVAPSTWEYVTKYDHPPVPERLAMSATWAGSRAAVTGS